MSTDEARKAQQGNGGFNSAMTECLGKPAVVKKVIDSESVSCFHEGLDTTFRWSSALLIKVSVCESCKEKNTNNTQSKACRNEWAKSREKLRGWLLGGVRLGASSFALTLISCEHTLLDYMTPSVSIILALALQKSALQKSDPSSAPSSIDGNEFPIATLERRLERFDDEVKKHIYVVE